MPYQTKGSEIRVLLPGDKWLYKHQFQLASEIGGHASPRFQKQPCVRGYKNLSVRVRIGIYDHKIFDVHVHRSLT